MHLYSVGLNEAGVSIMKAKLPSLGQPNDNLVHYFPYRSKAIKNLKDQLRIKTTATVVPKVRRAYKNIIASPLSHTHAHPHTINTEALSLSFSCKLQNWKRELVGKAHTCACDPPSSIIRPPMTIYINPLADNLPTITLFARRLQTHTHTHTYKHILSFVIINIIINLYYR